MLYRKIRLHVVTDPRRYMWILLDLQPKAKFHICSTELGARKTSVYCHMLVRFLSFSLCHINAVIVNQLKNWQSFMAFHLALVVFIFICLYLIWFSQISHCHEGRKWHINSRFYSLEILPQYEVYQYLNISYHPDLPSNGNWEHFLVPSDVGRLKSTHPNETALCHSPGP